MKKILIILGISLLVFVLVNFPKSKILLPDEMVGTWQSDDTRYADRFFRLSKTTVIFGIGESEIDVYFITDTKIISKGEDDVVQLSLHRPGEEDIRLSLIHENEEEELLRLLNQQNVFWYRISEDELVLF